MTGLYVRIKREGKYENVEIDQLTDKEWDDFLLEKRAERTHFNRAWPIVATLSKWIRDNVQEKGKSSEEKAGKRSSKKSQTH